MRDDDGNKCAVVCSTNEEFQITIRSQTLFVEELTNVLKTWEEEYQVAAAPNKNLRYLISKGIADDAHVNNQNGESYVPNYFEYYIHPRMTFSKLYFPEKEELLSRLEFFLTKRDWYRRNGVPYNIGLFLHGEPHSGCEKTSTLKGVGTIHKLI